MARIITMVLLALVIYGCTEGGKQAAAPEAKKEERTVKLNVDPIEEKRLQEAADNGSQKWRYNAVDAAHAALINRGVNCRIEECAVIEEAGSGAKVAASTKDGRYEVRLERVVKPDGIWTATEIVVKEGPKSDYSGQEAAAGAPEGHDHSGHSH